MNLFKNVFIQFLSLTVCAVIIVGCSGNQEGGGQDGTSSDENAQTQEQDQGGQQGQQGQQPQGMPGQQQNVDIDVSDEELKKFVEVATSVQQVQRSAQQKMIDSVKSTGLSLDEYQKIASSQRGQQMPGGGDTSENDFTDQQKQQFEEANQKINGMQTGLRDNVNQAIEDAGMDPQRFQKISRALRSDQELQQRFQQLQQQQGGGPGGMRGQGGGGR